ncbi:MAG: DUF3592 domain-containing protein [Planctomycetota bacterium]
MIYRFLQTVFLPIFLVGGVALALVVGPLEVVQAKQSRSWPTVVGSVASAGINETVNRKGRRYLPVIRYRYEVGGQTYESDTVSGRTAKSYPERSDAQGHLEEVVSGGSPTVHYNPDNPGQAVLTPGSLWRAIGITGIGVILLALCGWIMLRRRASSAAIE